MAKYVVKIEALVEAKDEREAAGIAKKLDETLKAPASKLYFRGQGVNLVAHRVEPTPQKQG